MRPDYDHASFSDEAAPTTKRKLMDVSNDAMNPKLQEFLKVMQPPSKSKVWANEDTNAHEASIPIGQENMVVDAEDEQSDDQYQPVPKRRRRSVKDVPEHEDHQLSSNVEESNIKEETRPQGPEMPLEDEVVEEEAPEQPVVIESTTSDADWIRSRTSRLLGLIDDEDDVKEVNGSTPIPVGETDAVVQPQPDAAKRTSDAGSQTDDEPLDQIEATVPQPEIPGEEPRSSARLFVRNLSYNTSQNDLTEYFTQYGSVAEVRELVDLVYYQPFGSLVMNILIGTAYALHMMLSERIF